MHACVSMTQQQLESRQAWQSLILQFLLLVVRLLTEIAESSEPSRVVSPDPSLLARKRKTLNNPPPVGKKRSTGSRSRNDPSVHPSKRVSEYPGEHLKVSGGKLFCVACREVLSVKSSTLANHMKSSKHLDGKRRLKEKNHNREILLRLCQNIIKQTTLGGKIIQRSTTSSE